MNNLSFLQKNKFFIILAILVVAIDLLLKTKIRAQGGFFVCNDGISFGINLPNQNFWLILAFFLFIFIIFLNNQIWNQKQIWAILLFLLGSLINFTDRLRFGCVMDYILFFGKSFPVFNIADILIFLGIIIFSIKFLKNNSPKS